MRLLRKISVLSGYLRSQHFSTKHMSSPTEIESHRQNLMKRSLPKVKPIPGVQNIILVSSGKGGVGKSTTAVNLATALKVLHPEKHVGLLDADVFGPSIPLMMNLHDKPLLNENDLMEPLVNYGVKCMSMGFLIEEGTPVIWRGLMVMQALDKLLRQVHWNYIDFLIIDTPPGTGDTHLSLVQNIPITGVILITTPQTASIQVTKRGAVMYEKLKVPIVGIVENMSHITCPSCATELRLFGNGTEKFADEIGVKILQRIGLLEEISSSTDIGVPIVLGNPDSLQSCAYKELAQSVVNFCK